MVNQDNKILNFLKEYASVVACIGGFLLIFTMFGFDLNIVKFYNSLAIESKVIFTFTINIILTLIIAILLHNKIEEI